jgi:probable phosphoglycerate mutase
VTTRVFVARHGDADYESDLVTDDGGCLSAAGRAQARQLGERLRDAGIVRVWCSPLARAVQTAEIAASVLGVDVVVREGLREYGVGSLAGTDGDEAAALGPVFGSWAAGDDASTIPGGESIGRIVARWIGAVNEAAARDPGRAVLVVTHGGTVLAGVPVLVGERRETAAERFALPGGGCLALETDGTSWTLGEPYLC